MSQAGSSAGWRVVYFIQNAISRLAPPLHSLHWKIFTLLLLASFLPAIYFLWEVRVGIERSHLASTEAGMIDVAFTVAESMSERGRGITNFHQASVISSRIFNDPWINLRVVVFDAAGAVQSDSSGRWNAGSFPEVGSDVKEALSGSYGSRWEPDPARHSVLLHSSVPLFAKGKITGAVSVIKPTSDVRRSILRSLKALVLPALLGFGLTAAASYALSSYLTQVIQDMARRAGRIANGQTTERFETWTKSELGDLAGALEIMRRRLEGRAYVEEMASALSHELKTPLTAIRGATDIVEASESSADRSRFLASIRAEVDRLARIVESLLDLSRIETGSAPASGVCELGCVVKAVAEEYRERASAAGLHFETQIPEAAATIAASADNVRHVLGIVLDNAFQFTPAGRSVRISVSDRTVTIRDEGGGIDPAMQQRVFDRFFTTVNPLTGRRGTGLGLAIARSIIRRNRGEISLQSTPGEGTEVAITWAPT